MPGLCLDPAAEDDLTAIALYVGVEKQNPSAARALIDEFYAKSDAYARQPSMGDDRSELEEGLRSFTFKKHYVAIYRPTDDGIDVLRVFHGARDYTKLFREHLC